MTSYLRETWLRYVLEGSIKPKPPTWWIRSQEALGRSPKSAYAIWHRSYHPARRYVIWDQAPEEDWVTYSGSFAIEISSAAAIR